MQSNTQPQQQTRTVPPPDGRIWRSVHTHACGKTIIIGEHAVVYGARAVAMPIRSQCMYLSLQADQDRRGNDIKFVMGDKALPEHVRGVVTDALNLLNLPSIALTLRGKSTLPVGAGLGSSATLCVVILRALAASAGIELSRRELAAHANILERRFHGNPSGLDTSVVAFEDPINFCKAQGAAPITVRGVWKFALIDSGIRAATMAMIHQAAPYFQSINGDRILQRFDQLAEQVMSALSQGDQGGVAAAMRESAMMLSDATVNTVDLQILASRAVHAGARAAKMTGAGGGGAVLCLLDPDTDEAAMAKFKQQFPGQRVYELQL